jgi:hypothetical protein
VHVELGHPGGVAGAERAAHHDDALDPLAQLGVHGQQQRHVGQRPDRGDGDRVVGAAQRVRGQSDRAARVGGPARGRQRRRPPAQPVVAVPAGRLLALRVHQRSRGPGPDRHVPAVAQRQQPPGVGGGRGHRHVAEHRADGQQVDLRRRQRQHDRHGVVDARVGVDDQPRTPRP